jgi:two-component system LytT family response regulator
MLKKRLTSIIIDDELGPRENLKLVIDEYCPELNCLATADSALAGKRLIEELNPDVVFLDVDMPVLDGFDFLETLPKRNFLLVFVTGYEEYAINAIKVNAVDYLVKPINIDELQKCAKRLLSKKGEFSSNNNFNRKEKVVIPQPNGFITLEADDIVRLEGEDCYTHIYLNDNKKITVSKTLKQFENALAEDVFFRIHKSHIINLKYFKEFTHLDGGFAVLSDGTKLEISRRRQKEFIDKVKYFLSK